MKTFTQTFQSCQATTEAQILDQRIQSKPASSSISGKNNSQASAPVTQRKSWFQGLGETVQQLVTKVQPQQDQEMTSMKKPASHYSFDDDLPEGKVIGGFKPKDQRKKLTADEVEARMKAYNNGALSEKQKPQQEHKAKKGFPFILSRAIVLYYCTSLVDNALGTVYFTQQHVCFVSGFIKLTEIFPLVNLTDVVLLAVGLGAGEGNTESNTVVTNLLSRNSLKLVFFNGLRSISITPMAVDCVRVKSIIELIKLQFINPLKTGKS